MLRQTCRALHTAINVADVRAARQRLQLVVVPGEGIRSPLSVPPPVLQETQAERWKRKERERERLRNRSRAKVPGSGRGRPPNASIAPAELNAAKDRRTRQEREAADARWAEACAQAAADDEYARGRGFSNASSYRDARHFELLPCGHRSNRPTQVGLTLCAEADRAGLCVTCLSAGRRTAFSERRLPVRKIASLWPVHGPCCAHLASGTRRCSSAECCIVCARSAACRGRRSGARMRTDSGTASSAGASGTPRCRRVSWTVHAVTVGTSVWHRPLSLSPSPVLCESYVL